MSELLIELCSEEIPAMMQKKAENAYLDIFKKYFQTKEIAFGEIKIFIGSRRITIYASGLDSEIKGKFISLKGPRVDSTEQAINGFCKSNNIGKAGLIIKNISGIDCYFYEKEASPRKTEEILKHTLHEPIMEYVWPKSMYWSDYKIKWVRPLRNILCIFDGSILPFKLGHLIANNITFGHRFMSPKEIMVNNFAEYKKSLAENFVILDHSSRVDLITKGLNDAARDLGLIIKNDPLLLEEVAGLVEYPVVMIGTIDQKFLKLPSEILVSSMRTHQKYFSLFDKDGNFAPYFLFVSNINPSDHNYIIKGNEKVLSARLSDALYFYHQDLKKTLEDRVEDLHKVVFHAKLGSLKAKTQRLANLVNFIDPKSGAAYEAALICKSDILSEVVGEFPNLQGIMGYYYALCDNKSEDVAITIRDHYKPQGPSDSIPTGDAAILALADKIDSLCGIMLAGEKPTGSKDPYAIRRLALGIIRIILENNLHQNIVSLIEFSCNLYSSIILNNSHDIILFILDRAKNYFKESFEHATVNAVVNLGLESDLLITKWKLEALAQFLGTVDGDALLNSYKRANNILAGKNPKGIICEKFFSIKAENDLFESLLLNTKAVDLALADKDFLGSLKILANMRLVLADFFDNVMVMDKNPEIANNRLLLLHEVRQIFNKIANFDVL